MLKYLSDKMKKSFSLVELMVTIGVFVLIAGAIIFLVIGAQQAQNLSDEYLSALQLSREGQEAVRSIRDRDWYEIAYRKGGSFGLFQEEHRWRFSENPDQTNLNNRIYTRQIIIEDTDPADDNKAKIIVRVSWGNRQVELVSYLTNWRE